jgi:hypothetical protein
MVTDFIDLIDFFLMAIIKTRHVRKRVFGDKIILLSIHAHLNCKIRTVDLYTPIREIRGNLDPKIRKE